jgi:hypothetical protein
VPHLLFSLDKQNSVKATGSTLAAHTTKLQLCADHLRKLTCTQKTQAVASATRGTRAQLLALRKCMGPFTHATSR